MYMKVKCRRLLISDHAIMILQLKPAEDTLVERPELLDNITIAEEDEYG
jgi:hypothetical protein